MTKEQLKEYKKLWYQAHKKERDAYTKEWRKKNPLLVEKYRRKYYISHAEERCAYQRQYRERKKHLELEFAENGK